jgi:hypothetical protein
LASRAIRVSPSVGTSKIVPACEGTPGSKPSTAAYQRIETDMSRTGMNTWPTRRWIGLLTGASVVGLLREIADA